MHRFFNVFRHFQQMAKEFFWRIDLRAEHELYFREQMAYVENMRQQATFPKPSDQGAPDGQ